MTVQHTWKQIIQGGLGQHQWPFTSTKKRLYGYQIYNIHTGLKTGSQFSQIFLYASHVIKSKWTEGLESK